MVLDVGRASKTDRRMLVGDVALSDRYPVHGHLADAVIVHESCHQNQHVENLMRLEPDVTLSGEPSFGHSQGVEQRSQNVQQAHQNQPPKAGLGDFAEPTLHQDVVDGRNDSRQSEAHEDTRTQWSQIRLGEFIPQRGDDRGHAQHDYNCQVDQLVLVVTIEAIVQPWNKRTHDEQGNATVVEFREEFSHHLRMAA